MGRTRRKLSRPPAKANSRLGAQQRVKGFGLSKARQVYRHFDRLNRGFVRPEADDVRNDSATNLASDKTMALAGLGFGGGDIFGKRRVWLVRRHRPRSDSRAVIH